METIADILSFAMLAAAGGGEHVADHAASVAQTSAFFPVLHWIVNLGIFTVSIGILLCLYRMLKGPHLADRVLAGDTMAIQVVALVVLLAIQMGTTIFFDAALIVAIIGFASTLAFAQYIGSQKQSKESQAT